jgi:hypothetical protein
MKTQIEIKNKSRRKPRIYSFDVFSAEERGRFCITEVT